MRHSRFISSTSPIAMNRNFTSILASILVCLAFGFLTGCGSSSSTPPPRDRVSERLPETSH